MSRSLSQDKTRSMARRFMLLTILLIVATAALAFAGIWTGDACYANSAGVPGVIAFLSLLVTVGAYNS